MIEQAKGMLAARADVSTDEAFQRTTKYAGHSEKVHHVCRRVIDHGFAPE